MVEQETAAGPVVICCAGTDAEAIRPVVADLESQGNHVVLLEGVESSPEALAPTVERLQGEGLYVLCRSKALSRGAVDDLRDILLANHVPFGRTLTVASTRPHELRERIGTSLRRLASGRPQRQASAPSEGTAPPKPETPDESAPTKPTHKPVPRVARKTQLGISPPKPPPPPKVKAKARGPKKTAKPPAPKLEAAPAVVVDDDSEPPARLTPAVEPEPQPAVDLSKPIVIQADELADLDIDPAPPAGADEPPTQPHLPPVRTGNTSVSPAIPRSQLEAIRTGDTALVDREALLEAGLTQRQPPTPPASPSPSMGSADDATNPPWLWVAVGAGALVLLGVVVVASVGGDDESPQDDTELARNDAPSEQAPARTDSPDDDDEAPADPDPPPAQQDEQPLVEAGPTRIGHALRNRDVRSLDVLLVSSTEAARSWDAAKEHCEGLDLAGLGTWRLPEVGELMSLTDAQMTNRGYYWTSTPADTFGDARLVWYARRSRVVTRSRDSQVLCVRGGSANG